MCVVWGNVVDDTVDGAGMPGGGLFLPRTVLANASASWATSLLLVIVSSATDFVSDVIAAALWSSVSALATAALARAPKESLIWSAMSLRAFYSASAF